MGESIASTVSGGRRRLAFVRGLSRENKNDSATRICHYGTVASLWTSWTVFHPGRRFFGDRNYRQGRGCGYFVWHDDQMRERPTKVINELLGHIERLYDKKVRHRRGKDDDIEVESKSGAVTAEMKKTEMRLKVAMSALLAIWVFIFVNHICS